MRRVWLLTVAILVVIGTEPCSATRPSKGCPEETVAEAYDNFHVVFIGRVVDIQETGTLQGERVPQEGTWQLITTMEVSTTFKGVLPQTVVFKSGNTGFNALPPYVYKRFEQGQSYLVFAWKHGEYLSADACGWTKPLQDATDDVEHVKQLLQAKRGNWFKRFSR